VDGYGFAPLTSAVNDALAMRDALTTRGPGDSPPLAASEDVTLLVSPAPGVAAPPNSQPATRDAILETLKALFVGLDVPTRLIFYFAGHGMSVSPDGRTSVPLILPADVADPAQGSKMIGVRDLLDLFAERGPLQQLWLVDACRDMPYVRRPRAWDIDWNEESAQGRRAQAAIFAVSPGGKALSEAGGQGRFTTHLLNGLSGKGAAADHVPGRGHCVTVQSLHEYVSRRVKESLVGYDDWTRAVQCPDPYFAGPALEPLRWIPRPEACSFLVRVNPPHASAALDLALEFEEGVRFADWPPKAPRRLFELRASLKPGMDEVWQAPHPDVLAVDLREVESVTINLTPNRINRRSPDARIVAPLPYMPTTGPEGTSTFVQTRTAPGAPKGDGNRAILHVRAADGPVRVRLRRVEYPWTELPSLAPNEDMQLAAGTWEVRTMLGDEVISAARVLLASGERRIVSSVAQISPLVAMLLPPQNDAADAPDVVEPSETIGPMQGAILPTLLPLLALKPFDASFEVLRRFAHLQVPQLDHAVAASSEPPFCTLALAYEGDHPPDVAARVSGGSRLWQSADKRIEIHVLDAGLGTPTVRIHLPGCEIDGVRKPGRVLDIAAPRLAGGVTAIAATVWPDGTVQASVSLYRLPLGMAWPQRYGDGLRLPAGRVARALALAAPLFKAGADLRGPSGRAGSGGADALGEFATGKWIDPVLGAIAFYSCCYQLEHRPAGDSQGEEDLRRLRDEIQINMQGAFPTLPDTRVIAALHDDANRQRRDMATLLTEATLGQPALTASVMALATAARAVGLEDHWSLDRMDRIAPGQVFNLIIVSD